MPRCGSCTIDGTTCQNKVKHKDDTCHIHNKEYNKCCICLNPVTKKGRVLECSHEFHQSCLERWKSEFKYNCPTCRRPFDEPEFKMTIKILSTKTNEELAHTLNIDENTLDFFNRMNINSTSIQSLTNLELNIENSSQLNTILQDIGISITDFNTLVPHTE